MKNIMPVQNQPVEAIKPHFHVVDEQLSIKYLENLLKAQPSPPKLVAADGQEIIIPESVYQVLYQTVHALASQTMPQSVQVEFKFKVIIGLTRLFRCRL